MNPSGQAGSLVFCRLWIELNIVFDAHAFDHRELGFQHVYMLFFAFKNVSEKIAADEIADAFAINDSFPEHWQGFVFELQVSLQYLLNSFPDLQTAEKLKIGRSEEHTSELQSLMRISYAVFCMKKKKHTYNNKI